MDVLQAIQVLESDIRFKSLVPLLQNALTKETPQQSPNALETFKTRVCVYTDGACSGNPGRGGWGVYFESGETYSGCEASTTNNRMELTAAIIALENAPKDVHLTIFTDSQYVKRGISEWSVKWKANGWKTASGGVVKNKDLWKRLNDLCESYPGQLQWKWVKGHSGDVGNTRADDLAVKAMNR